MRRDRLPDMISRLVRLMSSRRRKHIAADQDATGNAEQRRDRECGQQRTADGTFDRIELADVTSNEKAKATAHRKAHRTARPKLLVFLGTALIGEVDPARRRLDRVARPLRQVAGQHIVANGQQVEAALAQDATGARR
jgi:hypothetical protein